MRFKCINQVLVLCSPGTNNFCCANVNDVSLNIKIEVGADLIFYETWETVYERAFTGAADYNLDALFSSTQSNFDKLIIRPISANAVLFMVHLI